MSSKWIKQSIIAGICMFIMVLLVVVLANWKTIKRKIGHKPVAVTEAQTDPEAQGGQIGSDLSAFLRDDTFFNEKEDESAVLIQTGTKVSMVMDSVGRNLRITIVNSIGNLASGAPFAVNIEGVGTFVDEDEDGIILVEKLDEGKYFVSMEDIGGYIVPQTKTMITISKDIDFKALSDVEYLIKNAKDIDADADDTRKMTAGDEADGTENLLPDAYTDIGKIGIDVSSDNKDIDWKEVADAGIDYAIVRCGYRGADSGELILDSSFRKNMLESAKAGVPTGVYFFSQAVNVTEAIEEASMVISQCKLYLLDYPIYVVADSAGGKGRADRLSKEKRTEIIRAFCETVSNSGYEAGVYASAGWLEDKIDTEALTLYHSWLAQYSEVPEYEGYYDLWQYTSKGTVPGIETKVGLNVSYSNEKMNNVHN